jgi:hypothetical protein
MIDSYINYYILFNEILSNNNSFPPYFPPSSLCASAPLREPLLHPLPSSLCASARGLFVMMTGTNKGIVYFAFFGYSISRESP